jgi:hypothetical protein
MRQGHGPQTNLGAILLAAAARVARAQSGSAWDEHKPDEERGQAEPCTAGETEKSSRQERK